MIGWAKEGINNGKIHSEIHPLLDLLFHVHEIDVIETCLPHMAYKVQRIILASLATEASPETLQPGWVVGCQATVRRFFKAVSSFLLLWLRSA